MPITESSFVHDGMTLITAEETDSEGNTICSGCKEHLDTYRAYAYGVNVDESTCKFYSVHKRCKPVLPQAVVTEEEAYGSDCRSGSCEN